MKMELIRIEKKCPFCPDATWVHVFKTYHGLYRHIWKEHAYGHGDKPTHEEPGQAKVEKIRVWTCRYSKFYDIPVNGSEHLRALVDAYCKGEWNPSIREMGEIPWTKNGKKI